MTHTLYRFYDATDQLLYVGITNNPGRRFGQHQADKGWWSEVSRSTMQHFPTREALAAAEVIAIRQENPKYNVVHAIGTREVRVMAPKASPCSSLRFSVDAGDHARPLQPGEFYYRIELSDGREALIVAHEIGVHNGDLVAVTDGNVTLTLPSGVWRSAYMCEALMAYDPWSIFYLESPGRSAKSEGVPA